MFNVQRVTVPPGTPQSAARPAASRTWRSGSGDLLSPILIFCIGHSRTSLGLLFFLSASVRASPLLLFLAPDTHGLTFLSVSVRASPLLLFLAPDVHGLHSDFFFLSVPVRCLFVILTHLTDYFQKSVARTYVRRYAKGFQNIVSIASNVSTAPASSGFASQALIRLRALTSSAL